MLNSYTKSKTFWTVFLNTNKKGALGLLQQDFKFENY